MSIIKAQFLPAKLVLDGTDDISMLILLLATLRLIIFIECLG